MLTGPYSPFFCPFFRAKRAGPARLGPLRAGLGQEIEPACLDSPARFSNRAWRAGPKTSRASSGPGRVAHLDISSSRRCFFSHELMRLQSKKDKRDSGLSRSSFVTTGGRQRRRGDDEEHVLPPLHPLFLSLPFVSFLFYNRRYLSQLKGKCALGPFLSILVIECQLKCLKCEFMQCMNKV
jgi:hypothetical protein